MAQKTLPPRKDEFSYCAKPRSIANTVMPTQRCPDSKSMRIANALIDVGSAKTSGRVRKLRRIGPHSVRDAEKRPAQAKMNERFAISSAQYIASAAKGDKFTVHPRSHAVGVIASTSSLLIYGDRYDFARDIPTPIFGEICESFACGGFRASGYASVGGATMLLSARRSILSHAAAIRKHGIPSRPRAMVRFLNP